MFSHTSAKIVEFRNRVDGEGTFVLTRAHGWMAKFEVEGWSFVGIVGVLVSEGSSGTEVEDELDISTSMSKISGLLICSIKDRDSIWSGITREVVEAVCKLGVCCWGLSEATSPEATSEAFSSSNSTLGNSPE